MQRAALIQRDPGPEAEAAGVTNFVTSDKTYKITSKSLKSAAKAIAKRAEAGKTSWKPSFKAKMASDRTIAKATLTV